MKVFVLLITILTFQTCGNRVDAASSPFKPYEAGIPLAAISNPGNYQAPPPVGSLFNIQLKNRKLSFKEKLVLRLLKWKSKMKMGGLDQPTPLQRKLGRLSLIFGISAIVLVLIPYSALAITSVIGILSLPLAIAGLVLGIKSIRGNSNAQGLIGLILSGTYLAILLLAVAVLAIVLSFGGWY